MKVANTKVGDKLKLPEAGYDFGIHTFKDRCAKKETWKVVKVYRHHVLCEKKVKLGTIRRCVDFGELVRMGKEYGFVSTNIIQEKERHGHHKEPRFRE